MVCAQERLPHVLAEAAEEQAPDVERADEEAAFINQELHQRLNPEIVKRVVELNQYAYRAGLSANNLDYLLRWSVGPTNSIASAVDPEWGARQGEVAALQSIDKVAFQSASCRWLQCFNVPSFRFPYDAFLTDSKLLQYIKKLGGLTVAKVSFLNATKNFGLSTRNDLKTESRAER